jgi:hypothetical protein
LPSTTATPAQLVITGAEAATIPARFSGTAAVLRFTGASATLGPGTGADLDVTTPTLDRLTRFDELFSGTGPSPRFMLIWQQTMEAIENAFEALTTQVGDNSNIIANIQTALALAAAANDNSVATANELALANSFVNPVAVLSAANTGAITVAAHTRVYADEAKTQVAVNGGSLSGFTQGTMVTVFYVDAAHAGGAVTYQGTTSAVAQSGSTHVVGQVPIPAAGETDTTGNGPTAPGYTAPDPYDYDPRLIEYQYY